MDDAVTRHLAEQTDYIYVAERQMEYGDPRGEASTYALLAVATELRRIADALTNGASGSAS